MSTDGKKKAQRMKMKIVKHKFSCMYVWQKDIKHDD